MELVGWILSVLLVPIGIALIPFIRIVYFRRPELTIEVLFERGDSKPQGLSMKNDMSNGISDGEKAIQVFLLTWRIKIIITNNSAITAYYPKVKFKKDQIGLSKIDKLNQYNPIKEGERIELKGEISMFEECLGKERTHITGLPEMFNNFMILLEYKNQYKRTFYTHFTYRDKQNINTFKRQKPRSFNA